MTDGNPNSSNNRNESVGRRYLFSRHGQSTVQSSRRRNPSQLQGSGQLQNPLRHDGAPRRRGSSQRGTQPYTVDLPDQFCLGEFACPERLHSVFRILEAEGGHAPGKDGLTYEDFSRPEVFAALRRVCAAIREHRYCPHPTLLVEIPKDENRVRKLRLLRIIDRVVAKSLQIAPNEYWCSQLPGISLNSWMIWAKMQRVMRERKAYVLATDDIHECFPHAPLNEVMQCHCRHITQPDLLWLIETVIRGHKGPGNTIGLDQGSPYSPVAMELLLHTHLDLRLKALYRGIPLYRYVDNLTFICNSEHEGNQILQAAEEILAELDFSLKCEERPPMDIRDANFDRKVLGLIPRWQNGQLTFSIPESAYDDLQTSFIETLESPNPAETARKVAIGKIESLGPALVNRVAPTVIDRVISIARNCGFTELRKNLSETALKARNQWLTYCAREGGS